MLLDITQKGNNLNISKVGKSYNVETINIKIPRSEMFEWVDYKPESNSYPDSKYSFWKDGSSVYRKPTKLLNKFRIIEYISTLSETHQETIFEFNEPPKIFCDIETEYFGRPVKKMLSDPNEKITIIGYFNDKTKVLTVLGCKKLESDEIGKIEDDTLEYFKNYSNLLDGFRVEYKLFSKEYDMINYMFTNVIKKSIVMTGWNFVGFDWKYMVERARRIKIQPEVCSDDGRFHFKEETPRNKLIIDHMEMFHKWSGRRFDTENRSLEEASLITLKQGKIKYTGSIQDLYETDFRKYVYYNVVDTLLVYLIDKVDRTFMTFAMLGQLGKIESRKAFSPVQLTEAVMCREFFKDNKVLVWNNHHEENDRKIKGGFVKTPTPGIHRMIAGLDFASLYPSIMRMFNISPESYLGKVENLTPEEIEGKMVTIMGTVFDNKKSVTKTILERFYNERKRKKAMMIQYDVEIDRLTKILREKKMDVSSV